MPIERFASAKKRSMASKKHHEEAYKTLLFTIGFVSYFIPRDYAIGDAANDLWQMAAVGVSIVAFMYYAMKMRMTLRWTAFMLFLLSYYVLSTFLMGSDGNWSQLVFHMVEVGGFITLTEIGLTRDKNACLRGFLIAGMIMCAAHYVTFLRYRNYSYGMKFFLGSTYGELSRHPWFLLTHDNGSVFHFLPVLCCLWYWSDEHRRAFWIAVVASVLTLYMYWSLWSVTAMIVMTGAIIFFFIFWRLACYGLRAGLSYKRSVTLGLLFCGGMLIFNSNEKLVEAARLFGKNTAVGRGSLWKLATAYFLESPLFGMGVESDYTTVLKLGYNHCHNIVMQLLYTGGIVAAVLFFMGLYLCDVPAVARGERISNGQAMLCVAVLATFLAGTFDWDLHNAVQFFPFVMYHYSSHDPKTSYHDSLSVEFEDSCPPTRKITQRHFGR